MNYINYEFLINSIMSDKNKREILDKIYYIYSICFKFIAMNLINNIFIDNNIEKEFILLKGMMTNEFLDKSFENIKDKDLFEKVIIPIVKKTRETIA